MLGATLVMIALIAAPEPARGQGLARLTGVVTDLRGEPIGGASLHVLSTQWGTHAERRGRFSLRLPRGTWRLEASRIGYRADTIVVKVPRLDSGPLTITLREQPLALRGITVEARGTPPLARSVTTETVRQVPPLAEPDIFRALTFLPHVTQPNDLKGRIHLAGGGSDETGIRLDGHRLQEPFHMLGVLGAFNVATLDRADVLTHYLPASHGGRLSGVIDLQTRQPRSAAGGEMVASVLAGGVTLDQPLPGALDVLASGRLSWLGGMTRVVDDDAPRYGFRDGLVRIGRDAGEWRAEAIGFATRDCVREAPPDERTFAWGESLAGFRIERSGSRWSFLARASFNRASIDFDFGTAADSGSLSELPSPEGPPMMHSLRDWATLAVEGSWAGVSTRLSAGLEIDVRENSQRWRAHELVSEVLTPNTPPRYAEHTRQTVVSPYAETRLGLGDGWAAEVGVRVPLHGSSFVPAPRLLIQKGWDRLLLSVAAGRRVQFDAQAEEPIEGSITAPQFLLDEARRADVVGAAVEWRRLATPFGGRARLRLEGFAKRYPDRPLLPVPDPDQSREDLLADFPQFVRVRGRAWGLSVSGLAELGGVLMQGSYTYQRATEEYEPGEWSPTSWDSPHTVKGIVSVPIGRGWVLNAVAQAYSGRAVTPVLARIWEPSGADHLTSRYLLGDRNSARVPAYRRLDLGLRYEHDGSTIDWAVSAQVLNLLNRTNPIDYDWPQYFARLDEGRDPGGHRPGLPILPSLGVEVRW